MISNHKWNLPSVYPFMLQYASHWLELRVTQVKQLVRYFLLFKIYTYKQCKHHKICCHYFALLYIFYTVPKAILWKDMFICTVRNVYQELKKCFFTANHLAEKENFVLYIKNVCHTVFLSLQRNFSLPSSPLSFRAKSLLLSLFWY